MDKKINIKNIVAFLVLMENGGGIINKSPDYILEKYERYCLTEDEEAWKYGLDEVSDEKLDAWIQKWLVQKDEEKIKPSILKKIWFRKGYLCAVVFVRQSHHCGYVAIPKGHPYFGKDVDDIPVEVHGGITYREFYLSNFFEEDKDYYWVGFDCAHLGDYTVEIPYTGGHFWTLEEVVKETNKLADQLKKLEIKK